MFITSSPTKSINETCVEFFLYSLPVEMLTYEDEFLHTVTILLVPVAEHVRILFHELCKLLWRHSCIPLSCIAERYLLACLFEDVALMLLIVEIAETLCSDDALWPATSHKLIKQVNPHWAASYINVCADAVFLCLACLFVVMAMSACAAFWVIMMVMMMLMLMVVLMMVLVFVLMLMMMFAFMIVLMMVLMMMMMLFFLLYLIKMLLHFSHPCGRSHHTVEVEHIGVENLSELHVTIVTLYYLSFWLESADYLLHSSEFFWRNLISLVEQDDVAELNLLYYEILYVILLNVLTEEIETATKLILHAESINHGHNAIESRHTVLAVFLFHHRDGADGLCYRCRFADAACLNDDIVKLLHGGDVCKLLNEIHLQCAADTSVLQCHEGVVLLIHDATLLYEVGINVHLAYVVHDNGELYPALVGEYAVE